MNRREFTASMAAVAAVPVLPLSAAPQGAATVSAQTYSWAKLIARAQNRCTPAMLARHLRLDPATAKGLFATLLRDGVIRAPGALGVAQAARPITGLGHDTPVRGDLARQVKSVLDPLVNPDPAGLGCDDTQTEDDQDASTDQPVQTGTEER